MTDEQIEKGLECHCDLKKHPTCSGCPYVATLNLCREELMEDALAYINRLKGRIAVLEKELAVRDKALEIYSESYCIMCGFHAKKKCAITSEEDCEMSTQNVIKQAKQQLEGV